MRNDLFSILGLLKNPKALIWVQGSVLRVCLVSSFLSTESFRKALGLLCGVGFVPFLFLEF